MENKLFAVVEWTDNNGVIGGHGFVVRHAYPQTDGTFWIPNPYQNTPAKRTYKRECDAQKLCDKLNETYRLESANNQFRREISAAW
jgi:hypothetical protein